MPFESLSQRLQMSLRRISGRAVLNEKDIDDMMREVRLSLLEADVNYKVVKKFTTEVKEKAMGEKILKSLTPGDMVVKIVHDELKALIISNISTPTFLAKLGSDERIIKGSEHIKGMSAMLEKIAIEYEKYTSHEKFYTIDSSGVETAIRGFVKAWCEKEGKVSQMQVRILGSIIKNIEDKIKKAQKVEPEEKVEVVGIKSYGQKPQSRGRKRNDTEGMIPLF